MCGPSASTSSGERLQHHHQQGGRGTFLAVDGASRRASTLAKPDCASGADATALLTAHIFDCRYEVYLGTAGALAFAVPSGPAAAYFGKDLRH